MTNPPIVTMTDYEPVEPWTPKVGDRVRHRPSSECTCRVCGGPCHGSAKAGTEGTIHKVLGAGFSHTVWNLPCGHHFSEVAHRFGVEWDDQIGKELCYSTAIELTLLEGE